jgi:hypothetical protein
LLIIKNSETPGKAEGCLIKWPKQLCYCIRQENPRTTRGSTVTWPGWLLSSTFGMNMKEAMWQVQRQKQLTGAFTIALGQ